jgi:hypothetical protein
MTVEFRITEDDYAKAMQFHEWRQLLRWPPMIIGATMIVVVILAAWLLPVDDARLVMVLPIWALLTAVLLHITLPYRARRMYRK